MTGSHDSLPGPVGSNWHLSSMLNCCKLQLLLTLGHLREDVKVDKRSHAKTPRRKGKKKGFFGSGDCSAGLLALPGRNSFSEPSVCSDHEPQSPSAPRPMATVLHDGLTNSSASRSGADCGA